MEARGWIYYQKSGSGGTLAGILQDLEIPVHPQIRHVEVMKQGKPSDEGDPGGDPPKSRPGRP